MFLLFVPPGLVSLLILRFLFHTPSGPLFADALLVPYVPKWKITPSIVLQTELKTSQTVAAELQCQVTVAERRLREEKGAGAML
ncbi:hypothetical protein Hdeb2414_s0026g00678211 [Helianthus debilis subsp. tardiflorus]